VGFDPRGVGASAPLVCFESFDQVIAVWPPFAFPKTAAGEAEKEAADHRFADACTQRGGPIVNHMSTADAARDLDRLRSATGSSAI
jgi:pimeloyl-ACP methyl ester carboxylesterase